jgi:hypothetical protein
MSKKVIKRTSILLALPILFAFIFSPLQAATGQEMYPEKYPLGPFSPEFPHTRSDGRPYQMDDNGLYISGASFADEGVPLRNTRATGGPDDFGYTWDDTVLYDWIDATVGEDSGITGDNEYGLLEIGFPFRFYGNIYDQVYVSTNGFITFDEEEAYLPGSYGLPHPATPNNLIAPYWWNLVVNWGSNNSGKIYYLTQGSSPDRKFIVQWDRVSRYGSYDLLTFQVVLHENGDILMQYKSLESFYHNCLVGIEDSFGTDGLAYDCYWLEEELAIRFQRPEPGYRVSLSPRFQGSFIGADEMATFTLSVKNSGDKGNDWYDLDISTESDWDVWLLDEDENPIDQTRILGEGETQTVLVRVITPAGASVGADERITVTATSNEDVTKSKSSLIDLAIPAPFAQTYRSEDEHSVQTQLNWPTGQLDIPVAQWEYPGEPAIVETKQGTFVHVWQSYEKVGENFGWVLKYAVVDQFGRVITPPTALSSLYTGGTGGHFTYDVNHALAVAPDGNVGVIWKRQIDRYSDYKFNYNVWFAVISPTGKLIHAPEQITNNVFSNLGNGYYNIYTTSIAASQDNRFILAWAREYHKEKPATLQGSIMTMIRQSTGSAVTGINNITGVVNNKIFFDTSVTAMTGNRFFLTYQRFDLEYDPGSGNWWIRKQSNKYRIYNSAGQELIAEKTFEENFIVLDSIQSTTGRLFMLKKPPFLGFISLMILDNDNYSLIYQSNPFFLDHPSVVEPGFGYNSSSFSITQDQEGNAIITWMDLNNQYLFYALIDPDGNLLSGPSIFETGSFLPGRSGNAITTNSFTPPSGVDLEVEFSGAAFRADPGETAAIKFRFANLGLTQATNVSITLTLEGDLSYQDYDYNDYIKGVSMVSGANTTVTFELFDLNFGDNSEITVYVNVPPEAESGDSFDLALEIISDEEDADPMNNTAISQVVAGLCEIYLPLILR